MRLTAFGRRYEVVKQLGSGGMGRVYLATDSVLGRQVAIKVIRETYADDAELVERFHREARAAVAIGHPNIVQVFEVSQTDLGLPFIVMEALEGQDLQAVLKAQGRLPLSQAVDIAGQILFALGAAHRAGIVHRDLKPGNIFLIAKEVSSFSDLDKDSRKEASPWTVKLLDFGISRFVRGGTSVEQDLTAQDAILGSLNYMAPEQLNRSREVDGRADLYSVGVILYKCLSGQNPFGDNDGIMTAMNRAFQRSRPPIHELVEGVPPTLDTVLGRALAERPAERFPNATAFVEALRPYYGSNTSRENVASFTSREFDTEKRHDAAVAERAKSAFLSAETTPYSDVEEIITEIEIIDEEERFGKQPVAPSEHERVDQGSMTARSGAASVADYDGDEQETTRRTESSAQNMRLLLFPFDKASPTPHTPKTRKPQATENSSLPTSHLALLVLLAFGAPSIVVLVIWLLIRAAVQ